MIIFVRIPENGNKSEVSSWYDAVDLADTFQPITDGLSQPGVGHVTHQLVDTREDGGKERTELLIRHLHKEKEEN